MKDIFSTGAPPNRDIKVARQAVHDLKTKGREMLDHCTAENRLPDDNEAAKLKMIEDELEKAAKEVAEIEREMDIERNYHVVGDYGSQGGWQPTGIVNRGHRFRDVFAGAPTVPNNFGSFGEFLASIHSGDRDPRLIQATAAGMGQEIGTEGGFLIPTEYVSQMLDASLENKVVRPRADVQRMVSNQKVISGWDTLTNTGGTIGGHSGQWLSEGSSATVDTGATRQITLNANKLACYTSATNELVSDSSFERLLSNAMVDAIGWHFDDALLNGTGAGQPRGVVNDDALITVAKETSQVADTVVYENLTKMLSRLHGGLRNPVWVCNPNVLPQLMQLVVKIQNVAADENVGGSHIPALKEDGRGGFTLLGIPLVRSEKLATLGDLNDIILCDFSQMTVGLRPEVALQKSAHIGFQTDETRYRIIVRGDGIGRWSSVFTPKTGSTQSWCVNLAARA